MKILDELASLGQSVWYDFIKRDLINDGTLDNLINMGIRGITSNPSIFRKAIADSSLYDNAIKELHSRGLTSLEIYEQLVKYDIKLVAEKLLPVYEYSGGSDGFVSLEVNPDLAYDTEGTIKEAKRLFKDLNMPNIMIKVPATKEGVAATEELISDGLNINATLIFSVENYLEILNAYTSGLRKRLESGKDISNISSVASFFVSRVDTYTDKKLNEAGALHLLGKTAVANSKIAYGRFLNYLSGDHWLTLNENGANVQRLLWASTSTKNPAYSDILYVQELIGKFTVNTMPPATLEAFIDHGIVEETLTRQIEQAEDIFNELENLNISIKEITTQLQTDGVNAFSEAFHSLINSIEEKTKSFN